MTKKETMENLDQLIKAAELDAVRSRKAGDWRAAEGYADLYHKLNTARDTLIFHVPDD